jgi:KUP system potassium uptake protein
LVRFGFKDSSNIPRELRRLEEQGLTLDPMMTSYFLSRETIVVEPSKAMPIWRQRLFAVMSRAATTTYRFLNIPTNQVLELGTQVRL